MPVGLILLIGKYLFLGLIYLFLTWAFKGLFAQMAAEARQPGGARRAVAMPAQPAPRPAPVAARPTPVATPAPQPAAPEPLPAPVLTPPAVLPTPRPEPIFAPEPARARLLVEDAGQSGLQTGQVIELTAALTIGRSDDNGLVIKDRFCSSHHAMIFVHEGQRVLRDRESTNGTFHNGRRLNGDITLTDGDRVNIGTVALLYRAAGQ